MNKAPIFVTQPFLPPLQEFVPYLEKIWDNKVLTNNGPFHKQLEQALCEYLGVDYISLFANGTIALLAAIKALDIGGEVITTPYSFVATSHSLLWSQVRPVFVDINPVNFNLDHTQIEAAITSATTAIMPVHCYGNPCAVAEIEEIAKKHGLKVIYDAAHAFGVRYQGRSLLNFGDLSVLSFHATKVFNTFEGGAIVCPDAETKQRIDFLKNFGFTNEVTVNALGINGKMSEINAAFGLLQLKYMDQVIERRLAIEALYRQLLKDVPGLVLPDTPADTDGNASYFPIRITERFGICRDDLYTFLKTNQIYARRYFYPLITHFDYYRHMTSDNEKCLSQAQQIADEVLCLPIYPALTDEEVRTIASLIQSVSI